MVVAEEFLLSLTGPASHRLVLQPGVGSVAIGPGDWAGGPPDLAVDPDDVINWSVFDQFTTPSGYPWPRFITYRGNDTGFLRWAAVRPVEAFTWRPCSPLTADARTARIDRLTVQLDDVALHLLLPERGVVDILTIEGVHHLFRPDLAPGNIPPALVFVAEGRRGPVPAVLPSLPELAGARNVTVTRAPRQPPFDCTSLLQFPAMQELELNGSMTGLAALTALPDLRSLRLRNCPDLGGLPPLTTWPGLISVFAHDIEAEAGKSLRRQIRELSRADGRGWEHTSVTALRTASWFTDRYGRPFATWEGSTGVSARRAYRVAEAAIAGTTDVAGVEAAVRALVRRMNLMSDLDTVDREDVGDAVASLTGTTPAGPLSALASGWFDDERDF